MLFITNGCVRVPLEELRHTHYCCMLSLFSDYPQQNNTISWAVKIRRNILNG